jgi:hypothetical protein
MAGLASTGGCAGGCTERKNLQKELPNRVFEGDKRRESAGGSRALFSAFGSSFKALPADLLRVVDSGGSHVIVLARLPPK